MAPHFETDDGDIIFAAVGSDKPQVRARLGIVFSAGESAVADDNHAIGTAAFQKCMGEEDRFFYASGRVRCLQISPQFAEPAFVSGEGYQQSGLGAGAD